MPSRPRTCSPTSRTSARPPAPCPRTGASSWSGSATSWATGGCVVLTPFGGRVHAPWAMALEARLQERLGLEVQTIWSDDGIAIRLPEEGEGSLDGVEALLFPEPEEIEDLVVGRVGQSGLFASRFRENAARALLLPRRRPGTRTPLWQQRQRAADLLAVASRYGSFPILVETYREVPGGRLRPPRSARSWTASRRREIAVHQRRDRPRLALRELAAVRLRRGLHVRRRCAAGGAAGAGPHAGSRPAARAARPGGAARAARRRRARGPRAEPPGPRRRAAARDPRPGPRPAAPARRPRDRRGGGSGAVRASRRPRAAVAELAAPRRAVRVRIAGEERWIAIEDVGALPRRGRGLAAARRPARRSSARRSARSRGCWRAMPGRTGRSSPPTPPRRWGLPVGVVEDALRRLVAAASLLRGEFRPGGAEREWCDPEVLRLLRRRSLAAAAPGGRARRPGRAGAVPARLAGRRAASARRTVRGHGRSSGWPRSSTSSRACRSRPRSSSATCSRRGCPATSRGSSTSWARWARSPGSGAGARRATTAGSSSTGRAASCSAATGPPAASSAAPTSSTRDPRAPASRGRLVLPGAVSPLGRAGRTARCSTRSGIWSGPARSPTTRSRRCGRCAGRGRRRTAVRGRPAHRPRAAGGRRADGRWSATRRDDLPDEAPAVSRTERAHALALALLERHGVVTREAVASEAIDGGFSAVYPVLRAMEEAGRIRRGYFVDGLGAAQFALPGAVDRLRAMRDQPGELAGDRGRIVQLLAAADPANPYGAALAWPRRGDTDRRPFQRAAGAYVALVDGAAVVYVDRGGTSIQTLPASDDPAALGAALASPPRPRRRWPGPRAGHREGRRRAGRRVAGP